MAVKEALVDTILPALYAGDTKVEVIWGWRGPFTRSDIVCVGDIDTPVTRPTLGRQPKRTEHEQMTVMIRFGSYRAGPVEESQRYVTGRVYDLLELFDAYLRTAPGETLGVSAQLYGRIVRHTLTETPGDEAAEKGRSAELDVEVLLDSRLYS